MEGAWILNPVGYLQQDLKKSIKMCLNCERKVTAHKNSHQTLENTGLSKMVTNAIGCHIFYV